MQLLGILSLWMISWVSTVENEDSALFPFTLYPTTHSLPTPASPQDNYIIILVRPNKYSDHFRLAILKGGSVEYICTRHQ